MQGEGHGLHQRRARLPRSRRWAGQRHQRHSVTWLVPATPRCRRRAFSAAQIHAEPRLPSRSMHPNSGTLPDTPAATPGAVRGVSADSGTAAAHRYPPTVGVKRMSRRTLLTDPRKA